MIRYKHLCRAVATYLGVLVGVSCMADARSAGAATASYAYDGLSRLTRVDYANGTAIAYTYDAAGNRLSEIVDTAVPSVAIEVPTAASVYTTSAATLDLSGIAADDVAVVGVTWSNDRSGSGTAVGTSNWAVLGIPLQLGVNVLTVTATDTVGKTAVVTLTVTVAALTPTDTPTQTAMSTPTFTGTSIATPTSTPTPTKPATTATPTPTGTLTATPSVTSTHTPTATRTSTVTPTRTPTPTATPTLTPAIAGDANCDGRTSAADLPALLRAIGADGTPTCGADANGDGMVDRKDISAVVAIFFR